jgi:apolipoprotein N-acyltransferase
VKLRLIKSLVALGSGVLLFLSCADFDIWPLTWLAIVPLFFVLFDPRTEKPWFYGLLCGLTANGGGFYWIVGFLGRFGHLPIYAAIPIFLLLIGYQAITFSIFAWALRRLHDHLKVSILWLAPITYVAVELVVPYVFPWYLSITQAWVPPVIQIAELTGPLGVSFLLVLSNAALYEILANRRAIPWRRVAPALVLVLANVGYGELRIHQIDARRAAAPKLTLGVVQANIGIHEKWRPDLAANQLARHQALSAELTQQGADVIVWPESSYPYYFRRNQAADWPVQSPERVQRGFSTPILFGTLTLGGDEPYPYNSALLLDETGNVRGHFDKNILMVFGEYIPYYEQMKWLHQLIPATSNFARGTEVAVLPLERPNQPTVNLGPMICYEDIFPSFGRRLMAQDPNVLVNITNDAWFGRTSEPYEHMALSVYRTIETRLDLVRAVNTGVSAFIESTGRVVWKGPAVDPEEAPAPPFIHLAQAAVQSPQKLYATLGEWFGGLCLALTLVAGLLARARAGAPIRWPLVAVAAAALALALVLVTLGSGHAGLALSILARRPVDDPDLAFKTGLWLLPAATLGCIAAGIAATRKAKGPARLEIAAAVILILCGPALAAGRLEGEQAGLVISALVGIGVALLSGHLAGKISRRFT